MASNINNILSGLLADWVRRQILPDGSVEAIRPEFATMLGKEARNVSFDDFVGKKTGWKIDKAVFDLFEGSFEFYIPSQWTIETKGNRGVVKEQGRIRQSLYVMTVKQWYESVQRVIKEEDILSLSYHRLYKSYLRWTLSFKKQGALWLFAIYTSGDYMILIKADAKNSEQLETQLVSIFNSNPWEGWISAARKQDAS